MLPYLREKLNHLHKTSDTQTAIVMKCPVNYNCILFKLKGILGSPDNKILVAYSL